jgi:hypothetical protein
MLENITRKRAWILAAILALAAQQFIGGDIPRLLLIGAVLLWFIAGDGMVIARKALNNMMSLIEGIF